ncbi:MAG: hypothetical protein OHK0044_18170 [Burkholderiaceae bacterium]
MTVFPDTQAVTLQDSSRRPARRETFLSQTPLALVAIVAIAAIVAVNIADAPEPARARPAAAQRAMSAPASCTGCGEIVSIRPLRVAEPGAADGEPGVEVDVRMSDGSVRTVRQPAGGFAIGDRVRLGGNVLKRGG